uniref:Uncharacterized protein n=1 Tax=Magallana gigas TaxID=29159 RepID=A0A8W8NUN7_MAGGI
MAEAFLEFLCIPPPPSPDCESTLSTIGTKNESLKRPLSPTPESHGNCDTFSPVVSYSPALDSNCSSAFAPVTCNGDDNGRLSQTEDSILTTLRRTHPDKKAKRRKHALEHLASTGWENEMRRAQVRNILKVEFTSSDEECDGRFISHPLLWQSDKLAKEQSTTHHNRDSTLDSLPAQPHFMSTTLTHSTLFSVADQVTSKKINFVATQDEVNTQEEVTTQEVRHSLPASRRTPHVEEGLRYTGGSVEFADRTAVDARSHRAGQSMTS